MSSLEQLPPATGKPVLVSALETIPIASTDRHVEYVAAAHFEAPNWSRDGKFLVFNQDGTLHRLALDGSEPTLIPTAPQIHCNNDHGISPDGTSSWPSATRRTEDKNRASTSFPSPEARPARSRPMRHRTGTAGRRTERPSPLPASATATSTSTPSPSPAAKRRASPPPPGLDDGPEYSPDGAWIYFNSERTGHMQIWRMKPDGSQQEQVISDESNDWFPHISPDGQWMVFLAYEKGVTGHPARQGCGTCASCR
jgi:TolB protein